MKKLYFLNEEEKQRILNIHESATSRQYLSEEDDIWINCIKQYGGTIEKSKDSNWVSISILGQKPGESAWFKNDNNFLYRLGGGAPDLKGTWACNSGVLSIKTTDGATWTTKTKKWVDKGGTSTGDKAKKQQQYRQQIIAKTEENTRAIQRLLGLTETGVMDSALLQKINEKLNGNTQPQVNRPTVDPLQQIQARLQ